MKRADMVELPSVTVWAKGDSAYPRALLDLPDPPDPLYALGHALPPSGPRVAIVGTRRPTPYGERIARELASTLARAGVCVVSGMAYGIDGIAHRAALDESGYTVAVLGTGIDVPYPAGHRALYRKIARDGLVLSEYPAGSTAHRGSFPRRNRIIAALADVTIVVEAGAKSGALITAGHALELDRPVAAVPGPIDSEASAGTNELLRDGAVVIATIADALMLLGVAQPPILAWTPSVPADARVWDILASGAMDMDAVALRAGLSLPEALAAVTRLEVAGKIESLLTGEIRRR